MREREKISAFTPLPLILHGWLGQQWVGLVQGKVSSRGASSLHARMQGGGAARWLSIRFARKMREGTRR